jgi:hypothetical protein
MDKYLGKDNKGKPKQEYVQKLTIYDDQKLMDECESKIWLAAYAANNPRSDYHWHVDACYDECVRRDKVFLYQHAYKNAFDNR